MFDLLAPILSPQTHGAHRTHDESGAPAEIRIEIPKDVNGHEFAAFFRDLANRVQLASGLAIEKRTHDADVRVRIVLEALRDYLAAKGMDFDKLYTDTFGVTPHGIEVPSEAVVGEFIHKVFSGALTPAVRDVEQRVRTRYTNLGEDMQRRPRG